MKKIILLTLLISSNLMAQQLNITKISVMEGFHYKFQLDSENKSSAHIQLDCQSFLQKIDFYDGKGALYSENYISINECEHLYKQTKTCIEQKRTKCFDPKYIFTSNCECSN